MAVVLLMRKLDPGEEEYIEMTLRFLGWNLLGLMGF